MKAHLTAASLAGAALLSACGGGGGGTQPSATTLGTLGVSMTDAPACGFNAVYVTVNKVRIHQSSSAGENDAGWTDIALATPKRVDLLSLTNGALATLGETSLAAGTYTQLRLVLDPNSGNGLANSIIPTGGAEQSLDTPSAVQSGIKLVGNFTVAAGQRSDVVLDFDACKSVVAKGNGKYALKPVVKIIPTSLNGIGGYVASSLLASNVLVTAQQNGNVVAATVPMASGEFALTRLPVGNYDVVVTADNRAATVLGAVPVASATQIIPVSSSAAPLPAAPASNTGSISGTAALSPASATETALVSAKQTMPTGPVVTIRYRNADISNGAYTLDKLPVAAPQYAVYNAGLAHVFTAAAATPGAGKYLVEAAAAGYTTKSTPSVDIGVANQSGVNFTLTP